jgi:uncharacterized protein (TIGR04255 family)
VTSSPSKFDRPPVQEVVIGAYFEPLENLRSYHYGEFARLWRGEFPTVQDQPALPSPDLLGWDTAPIQFLEPDALPRCWFINEEGDLLIQLQRDRLIQNWRKRGDDYPHYSDLRPRFEEAWRDFQTLADELGIGPVQIVKGEVSYINPIPLAGPLAASPTLATLLRPLQGASGEFLPFPATSTLRLEYPMESEGLSVGTLTVQANPARGPQGEVFMLSLTGRGVLMGEGLEGLHRFHDLAHEWIVEAFWELTTPEMREYWGGSR